MSDTVLVTGGTGFIGRTVAYALREAGRTVMAPGRANGDIRDPQTLAAYHGTDIASVIHTAGRTFVPESWKDPAGFVDTNLLGTLRVLELCRATGARMVYLSAYLYGQPERLPIAETARLRPNNPYAHSKYLAEQACRFHADNYGVAVTIIRPFNVYGPGQSEKFLIPTIWSQIAGGKRIEMLDLEPRRDYVFLTDLIEAILAAEKHRPDGCETYNVGSGVSHSVAEIVAVAQSVAGTDLPVSSRGVRRENEIEDVVADISAANRIFGWRPRHRLSDGLKICWQDFTARTALAAPDAKLAAR